MAATADARDDARATAGGVPLISMKNTTRSFGPIQTLRGAPVEVLIRMRPGIVVVSHDIHHFVVNATDRIDGMRLGAKAASFRSRDVAGEQVVNAMVGGNDAVNLAGRGKKRMAMTDVLGEHRRRPDRSCSNRSRRR